MNTLVLLTAMAFAPPVAPEPSPATCRECNPCRCCSHCPCDTVQARAVARVPYDDTEQRAFRTPLRSGWWGFWQAVIEDSRRVREQNQRNRQNLR